MYKNLCGYLHIVLKSIHAVLHCPDLFGWVGKTSSLIQTFNPQQQAVLALL